MKTDETCVYCDPEGERTDIPPATRTTAQGEPVCARHWREGPPRIVARGHLKLRDVNHGKGEKS